MGQYLLQRRRLVQSGHFCLVSDLTGNVSRVFPLYKHPCRREVTPESLFVMVAIDLEPCLIGDGWALTPAVHSTCYSMSRYLRYVKKTCPHTDRELEEGEGSPIMVPILL